MKLPLPLLSLTTLTLAALTLAAQEKKISRSDLPPAVDKTVQAGTHGATIKGFSTEVEGGKKVYEAETIVDGHTRDLQIATDGSLQEIEEEVAFDALPASVQQALKSKARAAQIVKVESITKHGQLVAYEAATRKASRKGEVQVGPKGETLKHPE